MESQIERAGLKVDVYRNLQNGGYSIRSRESSSYGRVIARKNCVVVEDVEFVVQESGRQRVIEEERKNVHAFIRGVLSDSNVSEGVPVMYNPYEFSNFVTVEGREPVSTADFVLLNEEGAFAVSPVEKD